MRTNEIAQARNNPAVKAEAVAVRAAMGLTVSDALRMMVFALPPKRQGLSSRWFPVTLPRQSRGLMFVSRQRRLGGALTRPHGAWATRTRSWTKR